MKTKIIIIISAIIGISLPLLVYSIYENDKLLLKGSEYFYEKPLPKNSLINLQDHKYESENIKKGKVLLIFLLADCNACEKDVSLIRDLYSGINKKIKVYGVIIGSEAKWKKLIQENNIPFPVLTDQNYELINQLKIKYFPTKFVVEDGIIKKILFGNFKDAETLKKDLDLE